MTSVNAALLGALEPQSQEFLARHGFIAPSYGDASLSTVMPGIMAALGRSELLDGPFDGSGVARGRDAATHWNLVQSQSVFLIIVDGLGHRNLKEYQDVAPFLAGLNTSTPALSGFPSTTATSMSVLGTGTSAGITGLVGYSALNPVTGELGNFVSWKNIPEPLEVQRQPVLFEELTRAGFSVESIGLSRYNGSGMTQAALRGSHYVEANNLSGTFARALKNANQQTLTHIYWAEIDKLGHHYGVGSREWLEALSEFDRELERFVERLPAGNQVIITADHGMINVDFKERVDVAQNYSLARGLRGIGGEPRCTHVYYNSMSAAKKSQHVWTEEVGERGLVINRDEAIDLGLYGPVEPHVTNWIGHLMVLAKGNATIVDSESMSPMALTLRGVHGSLTPTEVEIPRISFLT